MPDRTNPDAIAAFVERVREALEARQVREVSDALAELESNLRTDVARQGGTPEAEDRVLASLGSPDVYARALRDALEDDTVLPTPQGRVLGMPYEFRPMTTTSVMDRIWNPGDSRIFMPRTFGVGWTVNFGALAVRLRLLRPDDVAERPFDDLPPALLRSAAAVPLVLGALAVVLVALWWRELPIRVPTHWNAAGMPDGWGERGMALGVLLAVALGLPVFVLGRHAWRRASSRTLAISSALLAMASWLATGIIGYTLLTALTAFTAWWAPILVIVTGLALPFAMLLVMARASLKAEWHTALGDEAGDASPGEGRR